ncbi:MAG: ketopantoate reductase family protein [Promethearchaeota archaeon]
MRILIIGAGSMGCLVGAKLSLAHHEVIATGSPRIHRAICKNGLIYHDLTGKKFPIRNFRMIEHANALQMKNPPKICIIASKAYSLPTIIQEYESILSQYSEVFLMSVKQTFSKNDPLSNCFFFWCNSQGGESYLSNWGRSQLYMSYCSPFFTRFPIILYNESRQPHTDAKSNEGF